MNDNLSDSLLEKELLKSISGGTGEDQITIIYRCPYCGAQLATQGVPASTCPFCEMPKGWA